ncbi:glycosyltransferase [Methanococcoides methylutens]|uniref:glycosyltransferase n=1 Tax=Methanococcoides methylutens TaxID=2226 RepID=UPI0040445E53
MKSLPSINFILPTLNEEKDLKSCLDAIVRQNYPKNKVKITIVDGGSSDKTVDIAKKYGCEVLQNEEMLAEPGVNKGITYSNCDLCCILAVDNILANNEDFLEKMIKPFVEKNVVGAFPKVIFSEDEPSINKYFNYRAEPFSEFIYGKACNSRTFKDVYDVKYESKDYDIYDFKSSDFPLLALAQGFMIDKRRFQRNPKTKDDDIQPIIDIIEKGEDIAYVKTAKIFHYQMMSIRSFIKKFEWRIKNNLKETKVKGTRKRRDFKAKQWLWLAYSVSLLLPFFYSLYQVVLTKKKFYIYHFITNTILLFLIPYTFAKVKTGKFSKTYK